MPACAALGIVGLLVQPKLRCYLCTYNNDMNIEFDPAKDAANFVKHGVSLTLAAEIEWSKVLCTPDSRRDYGEVREIGPAPVCGGVRAARPSDANHQPAQSQFKRGEAV